MSKLGAPNTPWSRVYLAGLMGSGKSTVGPHLARVLGWDFVDLDAEIERHAGQSISEIFARQGEEAFRTLEAARLLALTQKGRVVVSLGGGALTRKESLEEILRTGFLVYLQATPAFLARRLRAGAGHRPLLAGLTADQRVKKLAELLAERSPAFARAHRTFDVEGLEAQRVAQLIHEEMRRS